MLIKIKLKKPFKLNDTITCGQIFRFSKLEDGSYDVILKDRVINVYKKDEFLYVTSSNEDKLEEVVTNYFDLENDYDSMNNYLKKVDYKITPSVEFSNGLTMIKQDPFETVIEYIISSNNAVPQIANALNLIAEKYGTEVIFNDKKYFLFPSYKDLKDVSEEDFRACKVGFRDKYLKQIINKLNSNEIDLNAYFDMKTSDALESLMLNSGIGPKVASCILLFAYQKYDVFPVDTWVKKVMRESYNIEGEKNIRDFAKKTYGPYSGIAIQYLFNYGRNSKNN